MSAFSGTAPTIMIPLSAIVVDDDVQSRICLDPGTVDRYKDVYAAGDRLPPIVVFQESKSEPYILADGFHRVAAAQAAGIKNHVATILKGDRRDAILYAVSANLKHGLAPLYDDMGHAAKRLLMDPEWSKWSDREIARRTGYSHTSVGILRKALVKAGTITAQPKRTYTRGGKTQEMDTEAIGTSTAPAAALIVDSDPTPDAVELTDTEREAAEAHTRPAFSAFDIVEARVGALRARAITEIRLLTESGRMYAQRADQIRWNEEAGVAEFYYSSDPADCITLSELTIAEFAQQERLNYRLPNGEIFYYTDPIEALYPLLTPPAPPADFVVGTPNGATAPMADDDEPAELNGHVVIYPSAPPVPVSPLAQFAAEHAAQVEQAAAERTTQVEQEPRDTPGRRMLDELKAFGIEASRVVAHTNGHSGEYTAGFDFGTVYAAERFARQAAARYACNIVRAGFDLLDVGCDIEPTMSMAGLHTPMVRFTDPT